MATNIKPQEYWHGVAVSGEERNSYAQRIFDHLAASPNGSDQTSILSGDMLVTGEKRTSAEGEVLITITDATIRRRTCYTANGDLAY